MSDPLVVPGAPGVPGAETPGQQPALLPGEVTTASVVTSPPAAELQALATAVCRWHHAHYGQPIPCIHATKEARAIAGILDHTGYRVARHPQEG